jgi:type II secretory pathway component PulK
MKNKIFRIQNSLNSRNKGFIALLTILIVLGVVLLIGLGISQLSISEAQMALQKYQSSQAYYLASLCSERALMVLKEDINYTGENVNIENGNCTISTSGNLPAEIVGVKATFQNQTKKIKIVISQINPKMIIQSWQEVAEL